MEDLRAKRQHLQSFLLRHGRVFTGRGAWTKAHTRWMCELAFEHPAQHLGLVAVVPRARHDLRRRRALEAQRGGWQGHAADLRVVHPAQHPALVQVEVVHHLFQVAHRRGGHAGALRRRHRLGPSQAAHPVLHHPVHLRHVGHAGGVGGEARVVEQVVPPHRAQQAAPVLLRHGDHRHPAVGRAVDIIGRHGQAAVPVARARRQRVPLPAEEHAKVGGERRIGRVLHRHLHGAPAPGALALKQRGDDRGVEVRAAQEVHHRRPALHRRPVREAGAVQDARGRLHRDVHGEVVRVPPGLAVAGGRGVHQPRVARLQGGGAEAELVHAARREVLDEHVGAVSQTQEHLPPGGVLQVQREGLLVGVQHGHRHAAAGHRGAAPQRLAGGRLYLDDGGARHRHQETGVGPLVDLAEVEHEKAVERARRAGHASPPAVLVVPAFMGRPEPGGGQRRDDTGAHEPAATFRKSLRGFRSAGKRGPGTPPRTGHRPVRPPASRRSPGTKETRSGWTTCWRWPPTRTPGPPSSR